MKVFLIVAVILLFTVVMCRKDEKPPEPKSTIEIEEENELKTAVAGAMTIKKNLKDPDSMKLSKVFITEPHGAVCYEYRARNSFGGMGMAKAAIAAGRDAMLTSEQKGFTALWNKECAGKYYREVTETVTRALAQMNK